MTRIDEYEKQLDELKDGKPFMLKESGLPGPRGNLELAQAFCRGASPKQILELAGIGPDKAPENTPQAFLAFCGVMGLGKLIANGDVLYFARLRRSASDPRWRIREAVAMGLQLVGDAQFNVLIREVRQWAHGNWYEKRAAAAALCEPRLLKSASAAKATLRLLDEITSSMLRAKDRSDEAFRTLRQGMAYCWSVAIASAPAIGQPLFDKWLSTRDADVLWLLKQNLSKSRLVRMDPKWVKACLRRLSK
jgi:hypothetical protein